MHNSKRMAITYPLNWEKKSFLYPIEHDSTVYSTDDHSSKYLPVAFIWNREFIKITNNYLHTCKLTWLRRGNKRLHLLKNCCMPYYDFGYRSFCNENELGNQDYLKFFISKCVYNFQLLCFTRAWITKPNQTRFLYTSM